MDEFSSGPGACQSSGVAFYSYFSTSIFCKTSFTLQDTADLLCCTEGNCPNAYAYAFDEPSGTALQACDMGLAADYTVTFCP